ncbi:MAG: tetratricopeptide repeat protein [Cyanobacteria bacterium SBLK]|nr:tetratricopeptide repeat protein [Cyanobacteria bacterium SBLK]
MDFYSPRQFALRQQFYREIKQAEPQIDLAKGALYIACEEYADLDPDEYLNALDIMAEEVKKRLQDTSYPLKTIQILNRYLYEDLQFQGDRQNYYDPRNSFLNKVLDRRMGIPITLSLVYLEIAKRIDFPMVGIGMPGHFLIRPDFTDAGIFVDAFNNGEILFKQDCEALLEQIYNQPVKIEPRFLEPITKKQFLARMLTNLKLIYLNRQKLKQAVAIVERILLLFPDNLSEIRDRGLLYYQLELWSQAKSDLQFYVNNATPSTDTRQIREILDRLDSIN